MSTKDSIPFEQSISDVAIDAIALCPGCNLEHPESTRIVWAFPWGVRLTRCPRCLCQDIDYPVATSEKTSPVYIQRRAGSFGE